MTRDRIVKTESLIDKSVIVIIETTNRQIVVSASEWLKHYSCRILPSHSCSDPEILVSRGTREECETAFIEALENDLCDMN